jgi:NAD(P)-dependent dehydrogenase (short-subunit alcohol dehydrogenase family)
VVVARRREEAGKALVKELRSFGSEAEFINADVRKEDDVRALVDKTVARFAGEIIPRRGLRRRTQNRAPARAGRGPWHARPCH